MANLFKCGGGGGKTYFEVFTPTVTPFEIDLGFEPDYLVWHTSGTYGGYRKDAFFDKTQGYHDGGNHTTFSDIHYYISVSGSKITITNASPDLGYVNILMAYKK